MMLRRACSGRRPVWLAAAAGGLSLTPAVAQGGAPLLALAPVEVVLQTGGTLTGVAVGPDGTAYASDRRGGRVWQVTPDGGVRGLVAGLAYPAGIALDPEGRLLIAEVRGDRVVRREPSGQLTVVAAGVVRPRWLAAAPDGTLYIGAYQLLGEGGSTEGEADVIVRRDPAAGRLDVVARNIRDLQALALAADALHAVARRVQGLPRSTGVIVRYPVQPDGTLGPPAYVLQGGLGGPRGLALDRLGAFYVGAATLTVGPEQFLNAIGKAPAGTALGAFADGLGDPQGLALGPDGSLYLADGASGRLLRFRAPPPPALAGVPPYTRQSPLPVGGTAEPGARVDLFVNDGAEAFSGIADGAGDFSIAVPLALDAQNRLEAFATALGGRGLTSVPAEVAVTHDARAPGLAFLEPPAGAFLRGTVTVRAQASDGGSGVADVTLSDGARPLAVTLSPPPPAPAVTAAAPWDTTGGADGTRTLGATATDRAGTSSGATRPVIVDNTPPETAITGGPVDEIPVTEATFTFAGSDNLTPAESLGFAWRLDGGPFTPFGGETTATVSDLGPGPHTFEVMARDLAGNADPSPARRAFTVSPLGVQITSPAPDTVLPPGLVLVRGTAGAGGLEVGVAVNGVPAALQAGAFVALVPVDPTTTALTAVATTEAGATATDAVPIAVAGSPEDALLLRPTPEAGAAPLAVRFSLFGAPASATIELDLEGDGVTDFTGTTLEGQRFVYGNPGLYTPTVTVTDPRGVQRRAAAVVHVLDRAGLDALLQTKWRALRAALGRADLPGALGLFAAGSREAYADQLGALHGVGALPLIAGDLGPIGLVRVLAGAVEYELRAVRDLAEYSFHVLFIVDADGLWRLRAF